MIQYIVTHIFDLLETEEDGDIDQWTKISRKWQRVTSINIFHLRLWPERSINLYNKDYYDYNTREWKNNYTKRALIDKDKELKKTIFISEDDCLINKEDLKQKVEHLEEITKLLHNHIRERHPQKTIQMNKSYIEEPKPQALRRIF